MLNPALSVSSVSSKSTSITPTRSHLNNSISSGISVPPAGSAAVDPNGGGDAKGGKDITPIIGTKYIEWCWDRFARPTVPGHSNSLGFSFSRSKTSVTDTQDPAHHTKEWR